MRPEVYRSSNFGVCGDPTERNRRQRRAIVVSHEASRTGAPRVAIEITSALLNAGWDVCVILRWPGPLAREFAKQGARVRLEPLRRFRALRRWRAGKRLVNIFELAMAYFLLAFSGSDLVWCNTIYSACYVVPAVKMRKGVVMYVHEPPDRIAQVAARFPLEDAWRDTLMLACAPSTRNHLAAIARRPAAEINWLPPVPSERRLQSLSVLTPPFLPEGNVLIGACGTSDKRKGVDLWMEVMRHVVSEVEDCDPHFVWIGGDRPGFLDPWALDTGVYRRITFTGSVENPYPWMASLDIFVLTSREDQFPLVVLEAMHLGKPVVSFDVGNVRDQVGDTGLIVPPENCRAAAEAIVTLIRRPDERARLGTRARERARIMFSERDFELAVARYALEAIERTNDISP